MDADLPAFDHEYHPARVVFGRGSADRLADLLADAGGDRALVVTGSNAGANDDLMDPVRAGLGDRLAGVFAETTPGKETTQVLAGLDAMDDHDADAIVAVGGGSSLDVAKAMRLIRGQEGRPTADELRSLVQSGGAIEAPSNASLPAVVAVPTTFAGADLSMGGSVSVPATATEPRTRLGVRGVRSMPDVCLYDPALVETTPVSALAGSAMNGFNKGVELIYGRHATVMTDATATEGLRHLRASFPALRDDPTPADYDRAVAGTILVQYGLSTPRHGHLSVLHAYGHGLSRGYPVQQGVAHAVVAPHALDHLFAHVDGRRDRLAAALGVDGDDLAAGVVDAVRAVRDGLGLPSRLRDVNGIGRDDLPDVAVATREDPIFDNGPEGYDPSVAEVEDVLAAAW